MFKCDINIFVFLSAWNGAVKMIQRKVFAKDKRRRQNYSQTLYGHPLNRDCSDKPVGKLNKNCFNLKLRLENNFTSVMRIKSLRLERYPFCARRCLRKKKETES